MVGFDNISFGELLPPTPPGKRMYFLNLDLVRESIRRTGWNRYYRWYGLRYAASMFMFLGLPMRGGKKPRHNLSGVQRKKKFIIHRLEGA